MSAQPGADLAGSLRVAPGQARPHNLISSRRDWAPLLTRGMPAAGLPARLASLYSLCGASHRLCAQLALDAAGVPARMDRTAAAKLLQQETLREHVRRIGLDWPRLLGDVAEPGQLQQLQKGQGQVQALGQLQQHEQHEHEQGSGAGAGAGPARADNPLAREAHILLQSCPLLQPPAAGAELALRDWLQQLLGLPAAEWLARWERDPSDCLRQWSASTPLLVPRLLQRARPLLDQAGPQSPFLRVHSSDTGLLMLADALQRDPGFSRQPLWRGRCAETGSWTRLRQEQPERVNTAWLRLGARLAELVRLCLPDAPGRSGAQWLCMGSLPTAPRAGLAWVEMARGLLVHHVQLDANGSTVQSCQVLAPTEWNFHPQGAVAEAIERLPAHGSDSVMRKINALFSAYDPCVKHELMPPPEHATASTSASAAQEHGHA